MLYRARVNVRIYIFMFVPFAPNETRCGVVRAFNIDDADKHDGEYRNTLDNMNGYLLRVALFDCVPISLPYLPLNLQDNRIYRNLTYTKGNVGFDGLMMEPIAEQINFKPIIINEETDYGFEFNGTYYGTFGPVTFQK